MTVEFRGGKICLIKMGRGLSIEATGKGQTCAHTGQQRAASLSPCPSRNTLCLEAGGRKVAGLL